MPSFVPSYVETIVAEPLDMNAGRELMAILRDRQVFANSPEWHFKHGNIADDSTVRELLVKWRDIVSAELANRSTD